LLSHLKDGPKVVGLKQSRRAISEGAAAYVFLAEDADPHMTVPIWELCQQHSVPVSSVESMKVLGAACGISVGAAVAVLLN
jgi:large subunit ribosomal protein L7A